MELRVLEDIKLNTNNSIHNNEGENKKKFNLKLIYIPTRKRAKERESNACA